MTQIEFEQLLKRVDFKGLKFKVQALESYSWDRSVKLVLINECNDFTIPLGDYESLSTIAFSTPIRLSDDEEYVLKQVYQAIEHRIIHECKEWLKLDGQAIFNPHKSPEENQRLLKILLDSTNDTVSRNITPS